VVELERYVTVSWSYVDSLCRKVAFQIIEDGYKPELIVALAKGGWFAARVIRDYLGCGRLVSLELDNPKFVRCNSALVVDDLINTGRTMSNALKLIKAKHTKTSALLMLQNSEFIPDYLGDYLLDYTWVVFPWNFVEDLSELILKLLKLKVELDQWELKSLLFTEFGLDPLNLEISHQGKLDDVLKVLELRGEIKRIEKSGRIYFQSLRRLRKGGDELG